jgi:signal transduction histidine kinase
MRDEFMSMVSHEMRTPLNTLYLETQLRKMQRSAAIWRPSARAAAPHGVARRPPDPEHRAPDRRHAGRVAHPQRQAVLRPGSVELAGLLGRVVQD